MVRRARDGDLAAVAGLYHDVWHETHAVFMPAEESGLRTPGFFMQRMSELLPTTLVAEREGTVVGFVAWRERLLGQLYVDRACRGSGIASALLAQAERSMADDGVATAELHCVVGNDRARRFYERLGWAHKGSVAEPVAGTNGPVEIEFWCMTKSLIPGGQR